MSLVFLRAHARTQTTLATCAARTARQPPIECHCMLAWTVGIRPSYTPAHAERPKHSSAGIADTYGKWHAKPSLMRSTRPLSKLTAVRARTWQCHRVGGRPRARRRHEQGLGQRAAEQVAERGADIGVARLLPTAPPARLQVEGDQGFTVCDCCSSPIWMRHLPHTALAERAVAVKKEGSKLAAACTVCAGGGSR